MLLKSRLSSLSASKHKATTPLVVISCANNRIPRRFKSETHSEYTKMYYAGPSSDLEQHILREYTPLPLKQAIMKEPWQTIKRAFNTYYGMRTLQQYHGGNYWGMLKGLAPALGQQFIDFNVAFASGDKEEIGRLASFSIRNKCLSEIDLRQKALKGRTCHYELKNPKFSLQYVVYSRSPTFSISVVGIRVRGNQIAYVTADPKMGGGVGKVVGGSMEPKPIDELVEFHHLAFGHEESVSAALGHGASGLPSCQYRVRHIRKFGTPPPELKQKPAK